MTDLPAIQDMTPEEWQAYDEAMRGTLSGQMRQASIAVNGCLGIMFAPFMVCLNWWCELLRGNHE